MIVNVSFFVQLLKELERVTGISGDVVKKTWIEKWSRKIFEQARIEISSGSAISEACKEVVLLGEQLITTSLCCMYTVLFYTVVVPRKSTTLHAFCISSPYHILL